MRRKFHRQGSLFHVMPRSEIGRELEAVSKILDANPEILEAVRARWSTGDRELSS